MIVGNIMSSETKKCAVCGKKTGTYKEFGQTDIAIRVPACNGECYRKVQIKEIANASIKLIKKAIEIS